MSKLNNFMALVYPNLNGDTQEKKSAYLKMAVLLIMCVTSLGFAYLSLPELSNTLLLNFSLEITHIILAAVCIILSLVLALRGKAQHYLFMSLSFLSLIVFQGAYFSEAILNTHLGAMSGMGRYYLYLSYLWHATFIIIGILNWCTYKALIEKNTQHIMVAFLCISSLAFSTNAVYQWIFSRHLGDVVLLLFMTLASIGLYWTSEWKKRLLSLLLTGYFLSYTVILFVSCLIKGSLLLYQNVLMSLQEVIMLTLLCTGFIAAIVRHLKKAEYAFLKSEEQELMLKERLLDLQLTQERLEVQGGELAQLAEDLELARNAAEHANKAKSEFLATMSHEIRTPMNGILGMTGLLMETPMQPHQMQYAQAIQNSGQALLAIINDILDFSKLESGKLEIEMSEFYLDEVIESVIELLATQAHQKGIELCFYIHNDVPRHLKGDGGRIRQILLNLIGNAIKFTSHGGVSLEVSLDQTSCNVAETIVKFEVSDTGIGIAEEVIPMLFGRFTQADSSMARRFGGTGLGLAICKQLTELMQGEIGVYSRLNEGSTFWFLLPLSVIDDKRPNLPQIYAGKRVLVVEDNPINRIIYDKQLSSLGFEVVLALHGEQAWAILQQYKEKHLSFDVAIIDQILPGIDGFELGKKIRHDEYFKDLPLIMATAFMVGQAENRAKEIGFTALLNKPIRQTILYLCVRNALHASLQEEGNNVALMLSIHQKNTAMVTTKPQKQLRVLLAEDNQVNQMLAVALLSKEGHRVDVVANGKEAVDAVCKFPYDIVLMDIQMPEMDGVEATTRIRQRKDVKHIPIIALTANAMKGDREKYISQGMNDYLSKPINKNQLIEILEKWGTGAEDNKLQ